MNNEAVNHSCGKSSFSRNLFVMFCLLISLLKILNLYIYSLLFVLVNPSRHSSSPSKGNTGGKPN